MVEPIRPPRPFPRPPGPDPLAGLAPDVPVVLLPVRVETRWFPDPDPAKLELRIRVYPDEIHVAAPLSVTRAERADVAAYHALLARDGEAAPSTRARYAQLVERYGSSRAGWLVRALAPGAPPVPDADDPGAATRVAALPDHWIAIAKGPNFRAVAQGAPIAADLAAAPVENDSHDDPDTPALGNALAWITKFKVAEEMGMAMRLVMARSDAERLDELVVLGVSADDPKISAARLGELVSRHASSSGAALLAWGTPTNTTGERDAARATGERGPWSGPGPRPLTPIGDTPTGDAAQTLVALGIPAEHARDVVADGIDRNAITRAMHLALWPATWGYYLSELAEQTPEAISRARVLYLDHVRPAGPFPALRVRAQPYGILPATSLASWPAAVERGGLAALLVRVEQMFRSAVARVPRLVGTTDVDRDLVAVLRRLPSSRGAWVRKVTDAETAAVSLGDPFGWIKRIREELERMARAVISAQLGLPTSMRAIDLVYDDGVARLGIPFVAPAGTPPDALLPKDYLTAIATASASDLAAHRIEGAEPRTLLYLLARHAATQVRLTAGPSLPIGEVLEDVRDVRDRREGRDVRDHREGRDRRVVRDHRVGRDEDHREPAPTPVTARVPVWNRLEALRAHVFTNPAVVEHQQALRTLAAVPVGELELAFSGVLDSCSYRVDAWATALASERLTALRAGKPPASYVGGWAWLENPRPSKRQLAGGFLHAPSLAQARTAAVLRAGYEAHRADGEGKTLEIDISAERVRAARWLLAGMRDGRPLGRLLGDHLERWLVMHQHPELIDDVRKASVPAGTAPPDLADGWVLYNEWSTHAPTGVLADAFADLQALLDAVADLLVADSVYHALAGSPARAGAALDALERGEIATPDPRVDRTATDGRRVQRRVVLLLAPAPGWPGTTRPRAAAEPELEGLAARVLGKPERVSIDVTVEREGRTVSVKCTLADLGICALDAVLLAADGEQAFLDLAASQVAAEGGSVRAAVGGPALDELVLAGAALARLFRAAHTPLPNELGAVDVGVPPARTGADAIVNDVGLETLARPAPIGELGALQTVASSPADMATWLADMARVRPALEALDLLALVEPDIFRAERRRTEDGVELALYRTTRATPTAALVIDGWSEAPPASEIMSGAAFPYDSPRAQPPQSILLAVPPPSTAWSLPLLEAIVDETVSRAKLRMVSPDDVRGQLAPTVLVADNREELVPSIDLLLHAFVVEEVSQ